MHIHPQNIIDLASNPFIWAVITAIGGFLVKRKFKSYLKLVSILIDAIELVDTEIKDVLDDEQIQKLTKIKQWISNRVGSEGKVLDKHLENKGILKQGEYRPQ